MAKFVIEGQEIELQGIEHDTVVIARPTKKLSSEEFKTFCENGNHLRREFNRRGCFLIFSNFDQVTFEVLSAQNSEEAAAT